MKQNEKNCLNMDTRLKKIGPQSLDLDKGLKKYTQIKSELEIYPKDTQLPLKSSFAQKYFN